MQTRVKLASFCALSKQTVNSQSFIKTFTASMLKLKPNSDFSLFIKRSVHTKIAPKTSQSVANSTKPLLEPGPGKYAFIAKASLFSVAVSCSLRFDLYKH
jgi:hypothetical protein